MTSEVKLSLTSPFISTPAPRQAQGQAPEADHSYGSKFENIIKLRACITSRQREGVDSPFELGLSTRVIEKFLIDSGSDFFALWDRLKAVGLDAPETDRLIAAIQESLSRAFALKEKPWDTEFNEKLRPDTYYMVRSSGGEDGAKSNAGGNLSLDYVLPQDIDSAMAKVIGSYYEKQSLRNQENPFGKAHLSVFVHELIGERMGGESDPEEIPISGVIFSNEPLFTCGEHFQLMRVSATLGQGASVVQSKGIGTDTFLILQSRRNPDDLYIVSQVEPKPVRLAPRDGKLQETENPDGIVLKKTIDKKMAKRLFQIALDIEEDLFGGKPADIEFVIKNKTIYPVQARTVNRKPPTRQPSYIAEAKEKTVMKVLVPAHPQTFLLQPGELLSEAPTLEDAWKLYHEKKPKLVVVKYDEPANSHWVVQFSEAGVPCFFHPQGLELTAPAWVSPHQGWIATGSPVIRDGYIEHPAPLPISLTEEVQQLATQLKTEETRERTLASLQEEATRFKHKTTLTQAFSKPAAKVLRRINKTLGELAETFQVGVRLEALFYIKNVQVHLPQMRRLSKMMEEAMEYETLGRAFSEECVVPTLLPGTGGQLKNFLLKVEEMGTREQVDQLKRLLHALGDLKPFWVTFFFGPNAHLPVEELLPLLLGQMDEGGFAFVERLKRAPFEYFSSSEFFAKFKASGPLVRLFAMQSLFQVVDAYDKKMKGIHLKDLPQNVKILEFKERLKPLMVLAESTARNLVGDGKWHLNVQVDQAGIGTLNEYFKMLNEQEIVEDERALRPSRSSIAAAQLGSGAALVRHLPDTLEGLFSLAHQNILACIGYLVSENLPPLDQVPLPALMKAGLERLKLRWPSARLIGVEQDQDSLIIKFNIPQRNHSSTCQLVWKEGNLYLNVQILGQARQRWGIAAAFLQLLNRIGIGSCEKALHRGDLLDISLKISSSSELRFMMYIDYIFSYSLDSSVFHFPFVFASNYAASPKLADYFELKRNQSESEMIIALDMYRILAEKNQAIDAALKYVSSFTSSGLSTLSQEKALGLFEALLAKDLGYREAAAFFLPTQDYQSAVLYAFTNLIRKGKAHSEAGALALRFVRARQLHDQRGAMSVLKELIENGHCFDEAENAAEILLREQRPYFDNGGLDLFRDLIRKGRINKALETAISFASSGNEHLQMNSILLFEALTEHGFGFAEAREALPKFVGSEHQRVKSFVSFLSDKLSADVSAGNNHE